MLRYTRWLFLMLALGALTVMTPLSAQNTSTAKPSQVPRTADGKPDFSGTFQWPTYLPGATRGRSNATICSRTPTRFRPNGASSAWIG